MYKYLKHEDKKFPVRISNTVLGEWQAQTGKNDMKTLNFQDIRILMTEGLKAGYRFADRPYMMKDTDIELMVDNADTVTAFLKLIPEFYPPKKEKPVTGKKDDDEEDVDDPLEPALKK